MVDENLVSSPPINAEVVNKNGRMTPVWARWFQTLYQRTSFQGGNSIDAAYTTEQYTNQGTVRAVQASFTGGSGALSEVIPTFFSYNLTFCVRVAVGRYFFVMQQPTFNGLTMLEKYIPLTSHTIAAGPTSDIVGVDYIPNLDGINDFVSFFLEIYEIVQGTPPALNKVLFDPTASGDTVTVCVLSDIGDGTLPPRN